MLSTSTRRSTTSRLGACALLVRAGVALAAFASLLFAAGARAEPTGFASDESTFTFSASCASGADRCFWPMTRLDDIYYGREPRCDEWEVAPDGRRCKVYNEKATHGADPQALVANYVRAYQEFQSGYGPLALPKKLLRMGQCEPAYRSLKCEAFWSERRFESDGTVSWKPETREYLYAILDTQNGGVGEPGPPCQGYVAGLGCPTPAADRTRDAAAGSCSEPSGLTLVPQCMQHPKVGNPISLSNGAKVESRQDLSWPIAFIRSYSSANNRFYSLSNWRHNHESFAIFAKRSLPAPAAPFVAAINFRLEDGQDVAFTRTSPSAPFAAAYYDQKQYVASANALGYQLTLPSGEARQYDATGLMAARTWPSGYSLAYAYDARRRLSTISDSYARGLRIEYLGESSFIAQVASAGGASSDNVSYSYYNGFLTSASFNGGPPESYAYDSQGRMTSIADELGTTYAQFEYDPATGKAIQSKHLLGGLGGEAVSQTDVAYGSSSITVSRNGAVDVYSVGRDHVNYKTLITGASLAGGASTYAVEYSNGVATGSSAGYQSTSFSLDADTQLPTSKRDARGTTTYQWDAARRLLTSLVEPAPQGSRSVSMAYDAFGNMTSQTISSSQSGARTLTKTYGSLGKVLTATSSDGSTATLEYYPDDDAGSLARRGQLKSASNALGQKTTFDEYDERGRAIAITDANGVQSTLAFDDRGRVLSYGRLGSSISASYDAAGQLSAIQYSNGYSISFGYDDAHRRTSIADSRGDSLAIVYDANGNPIQESATQNSTLVSVANRTFTALGQLSAAWETNPAEKRSIGYDVNGWATSATDGLGRASTQSYNADGQPTGHSSPGISNVTTNRDVDGNMTSYGAKMSAAWNDFGEILRLSTDYAGNKTFSHDHANRSSSFTDAAGIAHADFMDALGRPTLSTHVLGAQSMSESVVYDTGRLGLPSSITDSASTQSWTWSERGLPLTKTQAVGASTLSLSYAYDGEGQLQSITYPSGMVVQYEWSSGRLASVLVNGQPFMANLGYRPFSTAPTSWTWGSGGMRALSFDGDGKISGLADSGILSQATSFDAAMRLASLTDGSATMSASYSPADQLAQFSVGGQSQSFTYDAGLNRFTKKNFNGLVDTTYVGEANFFGQWSTSSSPAVYRSIAYDSRKNMTNNGRSALSYDLRGDLATATGAGYAASYAYNAQHQRVSKTVNGAQTFFLYDEAGNLAGEYAAGGAPIAEHIYVGSLPVGASIGGSILAVHTDYLGTPRALSNGSSVAWRWESTDPFGANQPSIQAVVYNPRFPGQYYDQETGLHYNHHRTYDPIFGRYLQPDPMGVAAGKNPLNYVNQNPLNATDSDGLLTQLIWVNSSGFDHAMIRIVDANGVGKTYSFSGKFKGVEMANPENSRFIQLLGLGAFGMSALWAEPEFKIYTDTQLFERYHGKGSNGESNELRALSFSSTPEEERELGLDFEKRISKKSYTLLMDANFYEVGYQCATAANAALRHSFPDYVGGLVFDRFFPKSLYAKVRGSDFYKKRFIKESVLSSKSIAEW